MVEKNLLQYKKERNKNMSVKAKKVKCPCCSNQRLFDMIKAEQAEIEIKCQKCGRTINILFEHDQIHAKAV